MKSSLRFVVRHLSILLLMTSASLSIAQTGVLNPNDPINVYNPASPPANPAWNTLAKWVKTNRLSWNTSSYKAYRYNGISFRLKFPKTYQHGVADGKTYPLFIFWHGVGESGNIYDNEYQLYHGGDIHRQAVDLGAFDGFLLYPQNQGGFFGASQYDIIRDFILKYLVPEVKVDINRIIVNGLSGGGGSCWEFSTRFPTLTAASTPISAASLSDRNTVNTWKYIPTWHFQGGADQNPDPSTSVSIQTTANTAGANYRLTIYPGQGHGIWNTAWNEPGYFPFLSKAHKANPWPFGGKAEFCQGEPITTKLGVTAGFDGYEWRKNGSLIGGATTNEVTVTGVGIYDCRIKRGTVWSVWSPIAVELKLKAPTPAPAITIAGLMSKVIPVPDGKNFVTLQASAGYSTYTWQKEGSTTVLGTNSTYNATSAGNYIVKAVEQFGCASVASAPFAVVSANGPNKPDPATNLTVTALSLSDLRLNWSNNPAPAFNETNFEVYRAGTPGGPYQLTAIKGADVLTHTVSGLNPNTKYYFIIRAVNNTGAASVSPEANGTTLGDMVAPTVPQNLNVAGLQSNAVSLAWNASSDAIGVYRYDVYVNGQKSFSTPNVQYTVNNLQSGVAYNFTVRARDLAGNTSGNSNQVSGTPNASGLNYKYYHGSWTTLPNFSTLSPVKTGNINNFLTSPRTQADNFAFLWEGTIFIPVAGTYTFATASDAGSKIYIGPYSHTATPLVNNDGLHATQVATGSITLTQGLHPIAVTYFDQTGADYWEIAWNTPTSGGNWEYIPDSYLGGSSGGATSNKILVNFNRDNPAGAPWNNTNNVPQLGSIFALSNEVGKSSGIQFQITKDFSGENPFGMITGNNSGVYPDNVIRSSWWLDAGVSSQLTVSGLNHSLAYTFTFFGSRNGDGNRTTVYSIGSQSVSLNCSFNTSQTVTIQGVRPDLNGEALVNISLGTGSIFGYLGAMVINGYTPGTTPPAQMYVSSNAPLLEAMGRSDARTKLHGYPNPFNSHITISKVFDTPQDEITIRLTDLHGRVILNKRYGNVQPGSWQQTIYLPGNIRSRGVYFLQMLRSDGTKPETLQLIKTR